MINANHRILNLLGVGAILVCCVFSARGGEDLSKTPHSKEYWLPRIAKVHKGMKRAEVEKLLPIRSDETEKSLPAGMPDGRAVTYAVDSKWTVQIPYDFNGFIDDPRKNPYGVLHLYDNRVIGAVKLIRKNTVIDWSIPWVR